MALVCRTYTLQTHARLSQRCPAVIMALCLRIRALIRALAFNCIFNCSSNIMTGASARSSHRIGLSGGRLAWTSSVLRYTGVAYSSSNASTPARPQRSSNESLALIPEAMHTSLIWLRTHSNEWVTDAGHCL
eukprot:3022371-Rhodomonas_salina.4